jgi:hypothetical protein
MAIKANASSTGATGFKKYLGVGSFRVMGVNPTKEEMEKFYGREVSKAPEYLKDKQDANDDNKPYKQLRVTFLLQADTKYEDGKPIKENAVLKEPLKTSVSFFIDSRYFYNRDKTKVQVIDKYGRTAWVTIEQCKNHQIPVYANGPARLDADYRPAFRGEEELTKFILNYLNVTPIDTWNRNTGEWITNPNPEDCEGRLEHIKEYFKGNISELKEYCNLIPTNRVKILLGLKTDDNGRQRSNAYTRITLRNGSVSYTIFKDDIDNRKNSGGLKNEVYSDDNIGLIQDIHVYNANVKETDLSKPAEVEDPFAKAATLEDDLPFDGDPFADVA